MADVENVLHNDNYDKRNCFSKYWKYIIMIGLTGSFFFVELIFGIMLQSLALQADAFHMLSDLLAQIIALLSFKMTFQPYSEKATYGYKRADVIGGLINGVFLVSSCFFITLEAIHRFIEFNKLADEFGNVDHLLIVAGIGLAVNIFGVILFSCGNKNHGHGHGHGHGDDDDNMNVQALLLHLMGDILGSIGVIISGIIIKYVNGNLKYIADPITSLFIVIIILLNAIPLIKKCYKILVQKVPREVNVVEMKGNLLKIDGINEIHDFHVWQLSGSKNIGTMHLTVNDEYNFFDIVENVQRIMHNGGVHATTIQPEKPFPNDHVKPRLSCRDLVCKDDKCKDNHCCN